MKSYSLVRKFGSCVGSATLTAGLLFSVSSQSAAAVICPFLESKFFCKVYSLIKEEDLKVFNNENFWKKQTKKTGINVKLLEGKSLLFLIEIKKFCDINCDPEKQLDEEKRQKAEALKADAETVLSGDISKKIDEFFKSDFFKNNLSFFTGKDIPSENSFILKALTDKDEDLFRSFQEIFNSHKYVLDFCLKYFDDLATTYYNRINTILFLKGIMLSTLNLSFNGAEYLKKLSLESIRLKIARLSAYGEDLVKFKLFTADRIYRTIFNYYNFLIKVSNESCEDNLEPLRDYKDKDKEFFEGYIFLN